MKNILTFLSLFLAIISSAVAQDDYKVIRVNGTILLRDRGISLETGIVFSEREDLVFRSDNATAAVINPQKGRLMITSTNHDLSTAGSNYLPSMYSISSRAGGLLTEADIFAHFTGKIAVLEKQSLQIDDTAFPMNKNNFFFLRYLYKGEEINKKLPFKGNTFFIDRSDLLTVDGNPIPNADNTRIRLYYRRGRESLFLSEFDLIFPDMEQLEKETEIILQELRSKKTEEKIAEIGSYVTEMYGRVPPEELIPWLKSEFGIE